MEPLVTACAWTRERLSAFLDGELASEEQTALRQHLEVCSSCRRECEEFQAAIARLRAGLSDPGTSAAESEEEPYGRMVGRLTRRARLWPTAVVTLGLFWFFLLLELKTYLSPGLLRLLAALAAVDVVAFSFVSAPWLPLAARLRATIRGETGNDAQTVTALWIGLTWVFGLVSLAFAWVKLFAGPPLLASLLRRPASPAALAGSSVASVAVLASGAWLGSRRTATGRLGSIPQFLRGLSSSRRITGAALLLLALAEELFFRGAVQPTVGLPWAAVGFALEQYLLYERTPVFLATAAVLGLTLGWAAQAGGVVVSLLVHAGFSGLIFRRWR